MWYTWIVQGLAQYYHATGYEPARKLAYGLTNYIRPILYKQDGKWYGHHHSKAIGIVALADLAYSCNDMELGRFLQKTYEWSKSEEMGAIPAIGYFPVMQHQRNNPKEPMESCSVGDMTAIAVKLTLLGIADYWDDVDGYVRNCLVESQFTSADQITDLCNKFKEGRTIPMDDLHWPEAVVREPLKYNETADKLPEYLVGWFSSTVWPNDKGYPGTHISCCSGNCSRALYYVWENILNYEGNTLCKENTLNVNLLLNRVSQWADIESYIPYLGRVDIKIKTDMKLQVRMNDWIEKNNVKCTVDNRIVPFAWSGKYMDIGKVSKGQKVTIEFPIYERAKAEKSNGLKYYITYKGNDVVDISPKGENCGMFLRDHYRYNQPRFIKATNFVCENPIIW